MKRIFSILLVVSLLTVFGVFGVVQAQNTAPWSAQFYNNTTLSGNPTATAAISSLNVNWGTGSPAQGVGNTNWSARFATDSVFSTPGFYLFSILADDGATLRVNNVVYLDTYSAPQPGKTLAVLVPIQAGSNHIQVDFLQLGGVAYIFVNWSFSKPLDGGGGGGGGPVVIVPTPVPPNTLVPSATSVTTEFGNYTPCIQQNIHQSNCFTSNGAWNAPNLGSIQMEPQIVIWGNCTPDAVVNQTVFVGQPPRSTTCSKTEAGFFITPTS